MSKGYLIIDMQNDFIDGALGTKEAQIIVPKVRDFLEKVKANGDIMIFSADTHHENYLETQEGKKLPIKHCIVNTYGHEICDDIKKFINSDGSNYIEKDGFGIKNVAQYFKDVDEINIMGLCTDICVVLNALVLKGEYKEKIINVYADLCAGTTLKNHEDALNIMRACQINII